MATKAASKRLGKESQQMQKDPPPYCFARPREDNVLEWHFILRGPPDTPYEGGEFWGQLLFHPDYPFKPPAIKMSTPSGRFHTESKICTSMSDFHPGSWQPSWSVANILVGLLSFMCADEMTTGSVMATAADRVTLASRSHAFNITQPKFKKVFPDYSQEKQVDLPNMGEIKKAAEGTTSAQIKPTSLASKEIAEEKNAEVKASIAEIIPPPTKAATQPLPVQAQVQQQPARSKAFLPLVIALFAYLFLSRIASTMTSATTG